MVDYTDYVFFENSYLMQKDDLERDCPALACGTIDGYPADEDGQGTVICNVWLLSDRKFLIDWHHDGYRSDKRVLELIEETKKLLLEENEE